MIFGICHKHNFKIDKFQEITSKSHNNFKSFTFVIPYDKRHLVFQPEIWPQGVMVSKYTKPYTSTVKEPSSQLNNHRKENRHYHTQSNDMDYTQSSTHQTITGDNWSNHQQSSKND